MCQVTSTSFNDYLEYQSTYNNIDSLIDAEEYEKALSMLERIDKLPFGASKSHFCQIGYCYFELGLKNESINAYKKAIENGAYRLYFEGFTQDSLNTNEYEFGLNLLAYYDSVRAKIESDEYLQRKEEILKIYETDQGIRQSLHSAFMSQDKNAIDSIYRILHVSDSINFIRYNEIQEDYLWINELMYVNEPISAHVVLQHLIDFDDPEKFMRHLRNGLSQAKKGEANWREICEYSSFLIGRYTYSRKNTFTPVPVIEYDQLQAGENFDFIAYSIHLSMEATYQNLENKIILGFNSTSKLGIIKKIQAYRLLKRLRRKIIGYGTDSTEVILSRKSFIQSQSQYPNKEILIKRY